MEYWRDSTGIYDVILGQYIQVCIKQKLGPPFAPEKWTLTDEQVNRSFDKQYSGQ